MILPDTSIWIEYFRGRDPYIETLLAYGRRGEILSVEPIFGELLQGAKGKRELDGITRAWNACLHTDESGLWFRAGEISRTHRLPSRGVGLIDAFIWACAEKARARVWTLDAKLRRVLPEEMHFIPFSE